RVVGRVRRGADHSRRMRALLGRRSRKASATGSPSRVRLASVSGQTLEGRLVHPGGRFGPGGRSVHAGAGSAVELLLPGGRGDQYVGLLDLENLHDFSPRL